MASNIPHSVYLAKALHNAGWLRRYLAPVVSAKPLATTTFQPIQHYVGKFNSRRIFPEVSDLPRRPLIEPELVTRLLKILPYLSAAQRSMWSAAVYDTCVRAILARCEVFHFHSSMATRSSEWARTHGSVVICDHRSLHPLDQSLEYNSNHLSDRVAREFATSDFIIVNSRLAARSLLNLGVDEGKVFAIPLGVDTMHFRPRNLGTASPFRVLFVGSATRVKGIDVLARAARQFPPGVELRICGHCDTTTAQMLRDSLPEVRIEGPVSREQLVAEYCTADLLVLPSRSDSFGLVALEAMACGLPVVATDACGVSELLNHGVNGFVIPSSNDMALGRQISELASRRGLLKQIGSAARRTALDYSWDRYEREIVKFYSEKVWPLVATRAMPFVAAPASWQVKDA